MIYHLSIAAENPQHVAEVLAEILHGQPKPHPFQADSYTVFPFDEYGTEIDVYPLGTEITPCDRQQANREENAIAAKFTATNLAIFVPASIEEVEHIAQREDWLVQRANFGFDYILLWVENRLLLELLTPAMTVQYKIVASLKHFRKIFAVADI
jgi:hypothetical protein